MSHPECIVSIEKMSKFYTMGHGVVEALKEVSLTITKGDLVAIMGPSGSGKSTMMHLMGCLDRPTAGKYFLNGKDVSALNDIELSLMRATNIGFVFQSFNLIPQLNVYENVEVPFSYRNQIPADMDEKITRAIERVGLKHRMHHLPKELSGGEMQRVSIARALAIDPLIILADEPTGNLDSQTGKNILQLFSELNAQGVTVIIVTHDEAVGRFCQGIVRMKDGRIIENGIAKMKPQMDADEHR